MFVSSFSPEYKTIDEVSAQVSGVSGVLQMMRQDTYENAQDKENIGNGWHNTVFGGSKSSASSRRGSVDSRQPLGESTRGSMGSLVRSRSAQSMKSSAQSVKSSATESSVCCVFRFDNK